MRGGRDARRRPQRVAARREDTGLGCLHAPLVTGPGGPVGTTASYRVSGTRSRRQALDEMTSDETTAAVMRSRIA